MMTIEEAHLTCQDVSSTLEQAYGKDRARMALGFWAAASWPKAGRKIFSARKVISLQGDDAERLCAFLGATMPGKVEVYTPSDVVDRDNKGSYAAFCCRHSLEGLNLVFKAGDFDPWPKLRGIAEEFSAASTMIAEKERNFDSIHRAVVMETLTHTYKLDQYAQITLSWAGWGALCLGRAYSEEAMPGVDPAPQTEWRNDPDFNGLITYRNDFMLILARSAGDLKKKCKPERIPQWWDNNQTNRTISVCQVYRNAGTQWAFKLAEETGIEYIPGRRRPPLFPRAGPSS